MLVLGRYTRKVVDLSGYIAPNFKCYEGELTGSCGEDALVTLTGIGFTPEQRKRFGKVLRKASMVRILRKRGFTVIPLSVCAVSNNNFCVNTVQNNQVILNCQLMYRNMASWSICWGNHYCHNSHWEEAKMLEFINRPIIASYLVWHPSWDYTEKQMIRLLKKQSLTTT